MTEFDIPHQVKRQVRMFLLQSNTSMLAQQDYREFNDKITETMRKNIQHFLFFRMILNHNREFKHML